MDNDIMYYNSHGFPSHSCYTTCTMATDSKCLYQCALVGVAQCFFFLHPRVPTGGGVLHTVSMLNINSQFFSTSAPCNFISG